jgi:AmmeMemoRadiSam system protein A
MGNQLLTSKVFQPLQEDPALGLSGGAFVTLRGGLSGSGNLRGCIGRIESDQRLLKSLPEIAADSAFRDPRFPPVQISELAEITIELTILSPPVSTPSKDRIIIGTHGIILHADGRKAVFLPQVAVEQGWDVDQTLIHLCKKAGLPPTRYTQPGIELSVFEGKIIKEPLGQHNE